jgi:UDP-2-acetamido-3-amino-2,3-dideoxy-glucuronate N-acetyltransferase
MTTEPAIHETAVVDQPCTIGAGTRIWHFCHICAGATIGANSSLGQNTFVAGGAVIGDNVKIQNNVSIYDGVTLEDDVFLGPSCVLTNITNPRSQVARKNLYEKTLIRKGTTIGANATLLSNLTIGRYAFIAAGAVVCANVPDYALMLGVPAKQRGWMSRHGHPLRPDEEGRCQCPESGWHYRENDGGQFRCLSHDEETPLPARQARGEKCYSYFDR